MDFLTSTKGHGDIVNITENVAKAVKDSGVKEGIALVFAAHSTVAVTAIEYEPGVVSDLQRIFEKIAPEAADYEHHKRLVDHNGAAHVKSALTGVSFAAPVENGELTLGAWQQIVLIDFDERPRERKIKVMIVAAA